MFPATTPSSPSAGAGAGADAGPSLPRHRRPSPTGRALRAAALLTSGSVLSLAPVANAAATPTAPSSTSAAGHETTNTTSATARQQGYVANLHDFGAICDGLTDNRHALEAALAAVKAHGGGTIIIPAGVCRIVETDASGTQLAGPVTLQGADRTSTLSVDSNMPRAVQFFLTVSGNNVVLDNLTLTRTSDQSSVLLAVRGSNGLTLHGVTIDGKQDVMHNDCHGILLGAARGETISNVAVSWTLIKNSGYGLFQPSNVLGKVDGITVDHSRFTGNHYDDLEFNAPNSSMSHISVTNSAFRDNKYSDRSATAGIAVGFANVHHAIVRDNTFDSYTYDAVHIEDRSSDITVDGNYFLRVFTSTAGFNWASYVFIVSNSHNIAVTDNIFDTSQNTNESYCVFSTGGGADHVAPDYITVSGNTFKLRPGDHGIALQGAVHTMVGPNSYLSF